MNINKLNEAVINISNIAYMTYDFNTKNIFLSEGFYNTISEKRSEIINTIEYILSIIYTEDRGAFKKFIGQFHDKKADYIFEIDVRIKHKDFQWATSSLKSQILEYDNNTGLAKSICIVFTNITKTDEVVSYGLTEFQKKVFQGLGMAFVVVSYLGDDEALNLSLLEYTDCNKSFEEVFGISKKNIIGNKITNLIDDSIDFISTIALDVFSNRKPYNSEEYNPILNKYFTVVGFPISKTSIIIMFKDITSRQIFTQNMLADNSNLQEELKKRNSELETLLCQLNKELEDKEIREVELITTSNELQLALAREENISKIKSDFISMISHEYRTPLTAIQTSVFIIETLFNMQKGESLPKYIELINTAIKTMLHLLDSVLMLDSDERQIVVYPMRSEIISVCKNIIGDFKTSKNYKDRNIILVSKIEKLQFVTDITHLTTVIRNILDNACKFSKPEQDIMFHIRNENNKLIINIIDEGIGIPNSEHGKLFDPFFRCSNVDAADGAGLGLAVAAKYASVINTEIKIHSVQNEGTNVSIIINELEENFPKKT